MSDETAAAPLATCLSEVDCLKLRLLSERVARIKAEASNLSMLQKQLNAQHEVLAADQKVLFAALSSTYALAEGDELGEDGTIKRSPVRAIKKGG